MAELSYAEVQTVPYAQAALLNNSSPICRCNRGDGVIHTNGSGIITLKGNRTYSAKLSANIAVATGATVGEIGIAFAINGEAIPDTIAVATPAAVGDFWNVSTFKEITVPCGCCVTLSVENVSPGATPGAAGPAIDIRNLNVDVNPV
jgi:hypothetical protein